MKKMLPQPKSFLLIAAFILCTIFATHAQNTKVIGNKPRSGSANSSFNIIKGDQTGIKMKAGHKPVQLLQLNFDAEIRSADSIPFKVNVYEFNNVAPGENLVKQDILGVIPKGKNRISVNLEPYNIKVSGTILVTIEWLKSSNVDNSFAIGLFNGGTYTYEDNKWKKTPIAGIDFNVLVRKFK